MIRNFRWDQSWYRPDKKKEKKASNLKKLTDSISQDSRDRPIVSYRLILANTDTDTN